ncbi:hypothetical protein IFM89_014590 [Coptis chinensis]|uniref:Glycosyltransferase n=1 Tax=Coptis chinensis TaxID=261450 RepID=A0A835LEC7_9MAGN|nr:hypothetical protein IFM89_014590 [Coptis chinensis]
MAAEASQLHVFFFPLMAHGRIIPCIDIARQFAARGTKSTIITTPLNALRFADSIDGDKQAGLDIEFQMIPFPAVEAGLPEGCESTSSLTSPAMLMNFFKALGTLQQPFEQLLQEHRPDCIVSDAFFPWTTNVAEKYGIQRLCLHGASYLTLCLIENIERYAPHKKVTSSSEVFVVPGLPDQIELTKSQMFNGGVSDNISPSTDDKLEEVDGKSFGVLMNSFQELEPDYAEYYQKEMGRRSWHIGPVSLYGRNNIYKAERGNKSSVDDHHCLSWLDSKEPNSVLYVSFGSVCRFGTSQLLEIAMGLEASHVPFIWVVKMDKNKANEQFLPEGFEKRMEGKGLIIRDWAPQVLILDHVAVGGFMTHCGWNSILEGITSGVPLITWPVFAEQFYNEKLVTQVLKTGISAGNKVWSPWVQVEYVSVTKDRIEAIVTQLMGNGEAAEGMRRRATALGEKAKKSVENGGSSYNQLTALIEELKVHSHQTNIDKPTQ